MTLFVSLGRVTLFSEWGGPARGGFDGGSFLHARRRWSQRQVTAKAKRTHERRKTLNASETCCSRMNRLPVVDEMV